MNLTINPIQLSSLDTVRQPVGHRRYLLKQVSPGVFALQIDNSSLEVFTACARSAEYKLVHSREGEPRAALTYGGAVHNGLEVWYRSGMARTDEVWTSMIAAAESRFAASPVPFGEWRTFDRCVDTLSRYLNKYPTEPFSVYSINSQPQVELPFSLPLGVVELEAVSPYSYADLVDPTTYDSSRASHPIFFSEIHVYWTGKMDAIISLDDRLFVMDHKTTSIAGPTYFKEYELAQQTIGYCWAAQEIYGEPVSGLLLNAIIGRAPTKTGVPTDFQRQRYYYRPDQLSEWKENTLVLCSDFISNLARGYFPMETKWCVGKYGMCPYHEVCSLPAPSRLSYLSSDLFVNSTWSPLAE